MDVDRILQLAEALYGEDTRRRIFEPLVADLQRELAAPGANPKLTLRWRLAVVAAFVQCVPRAFTTRMSNGLWFEVGSRVLLFGALAFASQLWLNADGARFRSWQAIFAASLTFVIIPAVWRIRVSPLPYHRRLALARMFTTAVAALQVLFGEGDWSARMALAATAPVLAFCGWKLRDADRERISPLAAHPLMRVVMVATVLSIASLPVKLALGIRFLESRWSGHEFVSYLLAVLVVMTMGREDAHSPDTCTT